MKVITSFTSHMTAEGERISYTYSIIDESGNLIKSNTRESCILVDEVIISQIKDINDFLLAREMV